MGQKERHHNDNVIVITTKLDMKWGDGTHRQRQNSTLNGVQSRRQTLSYPLQVARVHEMLKLKKLQALAHWQSSTTVTTW